MADDPPEYKPEPLDLSLRLPGPQCPRLVEVARDQARTDFFEERWQGCDLTQEPARWRVELSEAPVLTVHHPMRPEIAMEHAFPFRDPADPRRVHPRFADAHGGVSPRVMAHAARLLPRTTAFLAEAGGFSPAEMARLRSLLQADVMSEMRRLIAGQPAPPRYEVKPLRAADLMPHEQKLAGQHGLFALPELDPAARHTLDNGRILGLYLGALIESEEDESAYLIDYPNAGSYLLDFTRRGGRLVGLCGLGVANGVVFANTALQPGLPPRYDEDRINALYVPFDLRLTDARGRGRHETVIALVGLDRLHGPSCPGREVRVNYGPDFLREFEAATAPTLDLSMIKTERPESPASPELRAMDAPARVPRHATETPSPPLKRPRLESLLREASPAASSSGQPPPAHGSVPAPARREASVPLPLPLPRPRPRPVSPLEQGTAAPQDRAGVSPPLPLAALTATSSGTGAERGRSESGLMASGPRVLDSAAHRRWRARGGHLVAMLRQRADTSLSMDLADWQPVNCAPPVGGSWPILRPVTAEALQRLRTDMPPPPSMQMIQYALQFTARAWAEGWKLNLQALSELQRDAAGDPDTVISWSHRITSLYHDPHLLHLVSQRPQRECETGVLYVQRLHFCAPLPTAQFHLLVPICGWGHGPRHVTAVNPDAPSILALALMPPTGGPGGTAISRQIEPAAIGQRRVATEAQMAAFWSNAPRGKGFAAALQMSLQAVEAGLLLLPPELSRRAGVDWRVAIRCLWILTQRADVCDYLSLHPRAAREPAAHYALRLEAGLPERTPLDRALGALFNRWRASDSGGHLPIQPIPLPAEDLNKPWAWLAVQAGIPLSLVRRPAARTPMASRLNSSRMLVAMWRRFLPQLALSTGVLQEVGIESPDQVDALLSLHRNQKDADFIREHPQHRFETDLAYAVRMVRLGMSREAACRYMLCEPAIFESALRREQRLGGWEEAVAAVAAVDDVDVQEAGAEPPALDHGAT